LPNWLGVPLPNLVGSPLPNWAGEAGREFSRGTAEEESRRFPNAVTSGVAAGAWVRWPVPP
jgi:hypothetical protein